MSGEVIVSVDLEYAFLENEQYTFYKTFDEKSDGTYSKKATHNEHGNELSERYAIMKKKVTDSEIEALLDDIRSKLAQMMTIESESKTPMQLSPASWILRRSLRMKKWSRSEYAISRSGSTRRSKCARSVKASVWKRSL